MWEAMPLSPEKGGSIVGGVDLHGENYVSQTAVLTLHTLGNRYQAALGFIPVCYFPYSWRLKCQ